MGGGFTRLTIIIDAYLFSIYLKVSHEVGKYKMMLNLIIHRKFQQTHIIGSHRVSIIHINCGAFYTRSTILKVMVAMSGRLTKVN